MGRVSDLFPFTKKKKKSNLDLIFNHTRSFSRDSGQLRQLPRDDSRDS